MKRTIIKSSETNNGRLFISVKSTPSFIEKVLGFKPEVKNFISGTKKDVLNDINFKNYETGNVRGVEIFEKILRKEYNRFYSEKMK